MAANTGQGVKLSEGCCANRRAPRRGVFCLVSAAVTERLAFRERLPGRLAMLGFREELVRPHCWSPHGLRVRDGAGSVKPLRSMSHRSCRAARRQSCGCRRCAVSGQHARRVAAGVDACVTVQDGDGGGRKERHVKGYSFLPERWDVGIQATIDFRGTGAPFQASLARRHGGAAVSACICRLQQHADV